MTKVYVECVCGKSLPVELEDTLDNEDWSPVDVRCECGERYRVNLHLDILGQEKG